AVTTGLKNAFFMSVMVAAVTIFSSLLISRLRFYIPHRFRLLSFMLVISTAVISAEQLLRAYYPEVARALGPYVGLIVTNCIVLGRLEAFASKRSPFESFLDSIGVSIGYAAVLLAMGAIREVGGNGTLWGLKVAPQNYVPCSLLDAPAGAFLVFALLIYLINWLKPFTRRER
ncbi:MAG: Rnf-Nqr domain containing protein, partial [Candidatus Rifleibacteriota bacterium]